MSEKTEYYFKRERSTFAVFLDVIAGIILGVGLFAAIVMACSMRQPAIPSLLTAIGSIITASGWHLVSLIADACDKYLNS